MAEAMTLNVQAFEPFNGGAGARMTATGTSSRVAIPGLEGGRQDDKSRVIVSNPNSFSVFVRLGSDSVVATLGSLEIIAGTSQLFRPPFIGPQAVYMSAITEGQSLPVSICSGMGT